jgi:hypothetical protein
MTSLAPADQKCLERTRSAVVNVLVAVAAGIAVTGVLLRWRDRGALFRAQDGPRQGMLGFLLVLVVASYGSRRILARRSVLRDPAHRCARLLRAHVLAAIVGALAIPLGFVYGWTVRPRLDAVAPFWVAALALGVLALPRSAALEGLDEPGEVPDPGAEPKRGDKPGEPT